MDYFPESCQAKHVYQHDSRFMMLCYTVKPVLSGPVLNGHPLLSGQL